MKKQRQIHIIMKQLQRKHSEHLPRHSFTDGSRNVRAGKGMHTRLYTDVLNRRCGCSSGASHDFSVVLEKKIAEPAETWNTTWAMRRTQRGG